VSLSTALADAFLTWLAGRMAPVVIAQLGPYLTQLGESIVGQLTEKLTEVEASVDAALTRVQEDVAGLQAQIAELQAKVDAGLATPEDIETLNRIKAKADALDPVSDATIDEVPTP
jgi:uncharacterized protein YPO0396